MIVGDELFSGLTLQTGKQEWFTFALGRTEGLSPNILVAQASNGQNLTVKVFDANQKLLVTQTGTGTITQTVPTIEGGLYFIQVSGDAGGYSLRFEPPLLNPDPAASNPTGTVQQPRRHLPCLRGCCASCITPARERWSCRPALLCRPDGSGEPAYVILFRAGVIS